MSNFLNWIQGNFGGGYDDYRRYKVGNLLGRGSGGSVYEAVDRKNNHRVAIKQIEPIYVEQAKIEAAMIRKCEHKNVIKILDLLAGPTVGEIWIVLEKMDGTLEEELNKNYASHRIMPEFLTKLYNFQLCRALNHLNRLNILHGDVKPSNILIGYASGCAKLADFGLAQTIEPGSALMKTIVTSYYRPPEVALYAQRYSFPVDVWSAGMVLAKCIMGAPFFTIGYHGPDEIMCNKDLMANLVGLIGRPKQDDLVAMGVDGKRLGLIVPRKGVQPLDAAIKNVDEEAKRLLVNILVYSPSKRPIASTILQSKYFDSIRCHPHCQLMADEMDQSKKEDKKTVHESSKPTIPENRK